MKIESELHGQEMRGPTREDVEKLKEGIRRFAKDAKNDPGSNAISAIS